MKYIGLVDYFIDEWHSNNYIVWINELCKEKGYDFQVKYAWSETETFEGKLSTDEWCRQNNIEKCNSMEELCEKSDYVMILAPANPEKHLLYAKTVLKYGKRTYIDKTFAPNLTEAISIFTLGKEYSCDFFSTSALRFATELQEFESKKNISITGGGRSFNEYIIHQIEMLVKLMGIGADEVKVSNNNADRTCTVKYKNGETAVLNYSPANAFTLTADGIKKDVNSDYFKILLDNILNFFNNGTLPFDSAQTLEVIAIRDALLNGETNPDKWVKIN